jgi:(p)ppGpp synthase/HD superfamily hydrolase
MERSAEQTEAKQGLEFELAVSDDLPFEGTHCIGRVHKGRGLIVHSRDCPEAEMAALRAMLEEHPAAANRS